MGFQEIDAASQDLPDGQAGLTVGRQVISVQDNLTVHLYTSFKELRAAYMYSGGDPAKMRHVKGFYLDKNNSLHCLKWDFYTCGHELFHALQFNGDKALHVEKGYEHFKGNDYASE